MGCESSDMVRFDLGPLQDQMRIAKLKSVFNLLIIEKCCLSSKLCREIVCKDYWVLYVKIKDLKVIYN